MEIECKFEDAKWRSITVYACFVTSCNITTPFQSVATFKGKHRASKDNSHVDALWFKNTTVRYIPRDLTKIFPNLAYLGISNCGMRSVLSADMIGLEKLQGFGIPDNKISSLPVDLFKDMTHLREVEFNRNIIHDFDVKILDPIRNTIECFKICDNPRVNDMFNSSSEIESFIKRVKLSKNNDVKTFGLLTRNILRMSKRFGPRQKVLETTEKGQEKNPSASKNIENLFVTSKHSDITIIVRDKEYKVHKCILASQSSVFDRMFSNDAEDASRILNKIKNYNQAVFEVFLSYFYSNAVLSEDNAIDLLDLAVEFDVPELKLKCRDILMGTINPQNALQVYNLAALHSFPMLKRAAFDVVKGSHSEIGEFLYEKPELINAIIEAKNEYQSTAT